MGKNPNIKLMGKKAFGRMREELGGRNYDFNNPRKQDTGGD